MGEEIQENLEALVEGLEDSDTILALVNQQNFREVSNKLVLNFLELDYTSILLTSHRTHKDIYESLGRDQEELSNLCIVDTLSEMVGQDGGGENVKTVNSPEAFNDINTCIQDFYDEIENDKTVLILDSFTSLLIHNSVKKTGRFVEKLRKKMAEKDSKFVILAVREQLEEETVEKLEKITDKEIEFF